MLFRSETAAYLEKCGLNYLQQPRVILNQHSSPQVLEAARRQFGVSDRNSMTSITMGLDKTEQEILAFEVADEALKIAAGTAKEKVNFTLGACTGLSECPG